MTLFQFLEFGVSKIISAGITFFIGFIIARFAKKLTKIVLHEADVDMFFKKMEYTFSFEDFAAKIIEFAVYTATIAIILAQFNLLKFVVLSAVVLFFLTLLVASVLNFKEAIPNFIARLSIRLKPGDKITINKLKGKVQEVRLFHTKILSDKKEIFYVPNVVVKKSYR